MRTKYFGICIAAALTACASGGPVRTAPMDPVTQVEYSRPASFLGWTRQHLNIFVQNNCSAIITATSFDHTDHEIVRISYSRSKSVRPMRQPLNGNPGSFELSMTIKAYDARGRYLGSATQSWSLDTSDSGNQITWIVDHLDSPDGAQCTTQR